MSTFRPPKNLTADMPLDEERELWQRWQSSRDAHARSRLIFSNWRFICRTARRNLSHATTFDDLISEGLTACMVAFDRFDPSREVRFFSYAKLVIRAEVTRFARAQSSVVSGVGLRTGSDEMRELKRRVRTVALQRADGSDRQLLASNFNEEAIDTKRTLERIVGLLPNLFEVERRALLDRWLSNDKEEVSHSAIGAQWGVTKQAVQHAERRAFARLRDAFEAKYQRRVA